MSQIPPTYQMGAPEGGPAPKQSRKNVWVWVLFGFIGLCGICGVIGVAVLVPVFAQSRIAAREALAFNSARTVANATYLYTSDNDDRYPPIDSGAAISSRIEKYYPEQATTSRAITRAKAAAAGYTWNKALSCASAAKLENIAKVWLFHSPPNPEFKRLMVGFADGKAAKVKLEELDANIAAKPVFGKPKK